MRELWSAELSQEETERLLRSAADTIRRRRLEVPAVLFAELNKPLANVTGHAGIVFAPFLIPFLGYQQVNEYTQVFSKRENWERLIGLLEEAEPPAEKE